VLDNKFFKTLFSESKLNFVFSLMLLLILLYYNIWIFLFGALIFTAIYWKSITDSKKRKKEFLEYFENLSFNMDIATKHFMLNNPLPIAISDSKGFIIWSNTSFHRIFGREESQINIAEVIKDSKNNAGFVKVDQKFYTPIYNSFTVPDKDNKHKKLNIIYFIDTTDYYSLKDRYEKEKYILAIIQVDNFEEAVQSMEDQNKSFLIAEVDKKIGLWASSMGASLIKFEVDKYVLIFENRYLKDLEENKFDILNAVREINVGNKIPVTLSIGIGAFGKNPQELWNFAKAALDIALGRGGDQAVIKKEDKMFFFGGKTQAVEKRTKVKARVIAHALRELIKNSDNVFIMGHECPDFDSIGASLGLYKGIKALEKEAYIILDSCNPSLEELMNRINKIQHYAGVFISSNMAREKIGKNSLLMVVDVHRYDFVEAPELLKLFEKIVIIDHHRRSENTIENPVLLYLEPYASSTSELVTELLQYLSNKIDIQNLEADALLAGITVDTKNFTFKTGVRTFEAASYLRRLGADVASVKQLIQNDIESFLLKAEIIKSAEMIAEGIVLALYDKPVENATLLAAQTADELINIKGISVSFVITRGTDGRVIISGRSLGDVNVQTILEKLGGGGHMTIAGAQLEGMDIYEVKKRLIEIINEEYKGRGVK